jgi:hypothetical protein
LFLAESVPGLISVDKGFRRKATGQLSLGLSHE